MPVVGRSLARDREGSCGLILTSVGLDLGGRARPTDVGRQDIQRRPLRLTYIFGQYAESRGELRLVRLVSRLGLGVLPGGGPEDERLHRLPPAARLAFSGQPLIEQHAEICEVLTPRLGRSACRLLSRWMWSVAMVSEDAALSRLTVARVPVDRCRWRSAPAPTGSAPTGDDRCSRPGGMAAELLGPRAGPAPPLRTVDRSPAIWPQPGHGSPQSGQPRPIFPPSRSRARPTSRERRRLPPERSQVSRALLPACPAQDGCASRERRVVTGRSGADGEDDTALALPGVEAGRVVG